MTNCSGRLEWDKLQQSYLGLTTLTSVLVKSATVYSSKEKVADTNAEILSKLTTHTAPFSLKGEVQQALSGACQGRGPLQLAWLPRKLPPNPQLTTSPIT